MTGAGSGSAHPTPHMSPSGVDPESSLPTPRRLPRKGSGGPGLPWFLGLPESMA